ncbi:capping protein inhibiting regulator of actin dynamics-like [Benincasa hispida]|uniref:capping protein inhibiting regulator of actin dynamics-like n=1 Tax=Benincasa hispida TaxID=102211 RepID=UPI001902AD52|nr:capping protein inhibiting regulator of actin dynamics-like [Benincasa hispida]
MEKEGGLPEAGVINQPLPSEEEKAEASRRSALAVLDHKETVQIESYEGPIRVSLEEVEAKKLSETDEGKKKRKSKSKRAKGDEETWPKKERKEKKSSEKRKRRREDNRLKKEEKRKRAESPDIDGESTIARVEEGVSKQEKESAQPQEASTHIRTVATEDREDPDITPLMRRRKENASQRSTSDPQFCQSLAEEKERRKREEEEKQEKMLRAQQIIAAGNLKRKLQDEEINSLA